MGHVCFVTWFSCSSSIVGGSFLNDIRHLDIPGYSCNGRVVYYSTIFVTWGVYNFLVAVET